MDQSRAQRDSAVVVPDDVREALVEEARKLTEQRLDAGEPYSPHGEGVDTVLSHLEQVGWLGPYGIIPGGMDNEPNEKWAPIYRIRKPHGLTPEHDNPPNLRG